MFPPSVIFSCNALHESIVKSASFKSRINLSISFNSVSNTSLFINSAIDCKSTILSPVRCPSFPRNVALVLYSKCAFKLMSLGLEDSKSTV